MTRNDWAKPSRASHSTQSPSSVRRSFLLSVCVGGLAVVTLPLLLLMQRPLHKRIDAPDADSSIQSISKSAMPGAANKKMPDRAFLGPSDLGFHHSVGAEWANKAQQLVNTLTEISAEPGGFTPELADKWKRTLEQLIQQGRAAVPALEEFFQSNGDFRLDSVPGGNLVDEPTLRIAFLKALFDIPTPDNVELQERVLRTTRNPEEIALLARQLELQEPGEYRQTIIEAATAVLAGNGQLPDRDAEKLNKLLSDYGVKALR